MATNDQRLESPVNTNSDFMEWFKQTFLRITSSIDITSGKEIKVSKEDE